MPQTISVMTLNIWNDQGPWPQRARLIREEIKKLNPDLIGFQEVLRGEGVDLLDDILVGTTYYQDFVEAMDSWPRPGCGFWQCSRISMANNGSCGVDLA